MNPRFVCAFLAAAAAIQAVDTARVKQYSAAADLNAINGYAAIVPAGSDFKTAAMVDVSAQSSNNGAAQTRSDAKRTSNFTTAAVTAAVGKVVPQPVLAEVAEPPAGSRIAFKQSWNSAQAWATMQGDGMPYLAMQAFGKSTASGTASWSAKLTMGQANGLYVKFKLPQVTVKGTLEQDGPSVYQGRFRAELLVNGHSVWTSEANRTNELFSNNGDECSVTSEKKNVLLPFGASTGLTSNQQTAAPARTVPLGLGQFAAGQQVDVTLIVRADSQVNRICCIKTVNNVPESFCTGMVATVSWSNEVNPVTFKTGPVI